MLDINELRTAVEVAGLNAISREEVLELLDRLAGAEREREALLEALKHIVRTAVTRATGE